MTDQSLWVKQPPSGIKNVCCSNKYLKKKDVIILTAVMILNRFSIIKCSSSGGGFCNFFKTLQMIVFYVSRYGIPNFCPLISK